MEERGGDGNEEKSESRRRNKAEEKSSRWCLRIKISLSLESSAVNPDTGHPTACCSCCATQRHVTFARRGEPPKPRVATPRPPPLAPRRLLRVSKACHRPDQHVERRRMAQLTHACSHEQARAPFDPHRRPNERRRGVGPSPLLSDGRCGKAFRGAHGGRNSA